MKKHQLTALVLNAVVASGIAVGAPALADETLDSIHSQIESVKKSGKGAGELAAAMSAIAGDQIGNTELYQLALDAIKKSAPDTDPAQPLAMVNLAKVTTEKTQVNYLMQQAVLLERKSRPESLALANYLHYMAAFVSQTDPAKACLYFDEIYDIRSKAAPDNQEMRDYTLHSFRRYGEMWLAGNQAHGGDTVAPLKFLTKICHEQKLPEEEAVYAKQVAAKASAAESLYAPKGSSVEATLKQPIPTTTPESLQSLSPDLLKCYQLAKQLNQYDPSSGACADGQELVALEKMVATAAAANPLNMADKAALAERLQFRVHRKNASQFEAGVNAILSAKIPRRKISLSKGYVLPTYLGADFRVITVLDDKDQEISQFAFQSSTFK